jgi:hypothetical protein
VFGFHKDRDRQFTSDDADAEYTLRLSEDGNNDLQANLALYIRSEDSSSDHHFTASVLLLHITF